jgi:23S rRNA (pseudouridine1915-N3)-methyltransferase
MCRTEEVYLKAEKILEKTAGAQQGALKREGERILQAVGSRDRLIVLDPSGREHTSPELAKRMQSWMSGGSRAICFALGSPWGLDESLKGQAHESWSLGRLTLPHDLARVIVWEQLYRAETILRGEPYHK